MAKACIVSIGSVNLDLQVRSDRWPEPGETLPASDFLAVGGGKAANVAILARRMGVPAILGTRLGQDPFARLALEPLRAAGVELRHTRRVRGESTGVALITVQPDGEKTILLAGNANDAWGARGPADAAAAVAAAGEGSVLVIDLEIPVEVVRGALHAAHDRAMPVVLDPSPAARMADDLYAQADYLTPNAAEAKRLTGTEDALEAARALRAKGASVVLAKMGGGGCALVSATHEEVLESPAPERVLDKTGAGDAFAGALGVALLKGRAPREAAHLAMAAASVAVAGYGSQAPFADRERIEALLAA